MRNSHSSFDLLIVGLGNPGDDYEHTLHNIGFDVVDLISEEGDVNYWKEECGAKTARIKVGEKNVLIAKPQSFMNTSGGPVSELMKKYKLKSSSLVVVHDDLDLDPGVVRVKNKGTAGGHNGVKSIINKLGSNDFVHVKVGIGHPKGRKPVVDWVLNRPLKEDAIAINEGIDVASRAVLALCEKSVDKVQNEFN